MYETVQLVPDHISCMELYNQTKTFYVWNCTIIARHVLELTIIPRSQHFMKELYMYSQNLPDHILGYMNIYNQSIMFCEFSSGLYVHKDKTIYGLYIYV